MTSAQCRAARALLNWKQTDRAKRAGIGIATVLNFEAGATIMRANIAVIKIAFEAANIEFIDDGVASPEGGEGVRLRQSP